MKTDLLPESWRLQVVGMRGATDHPRFVSDVTTWEYRYGTSVPDQDKGHETKIDPNSLTARKMAPELMIATAERDENQTGRKSRGREEAGKSNSTLPQGTSGLLLTMDDLAQLPRNQLVTQFKCIEGWSQIVHWAGIRMADFLDAYPPQPIRGEEPRYVYMETPDGDYYTGYDLRALRHPQTLLVTEMMGAPLTQPHGAPLRLHMPTKYGYKQIKAHRTDCVYQRQARRLLDQARLRLVRGPLKYTASCCSRSLREPSSMQPSDRTQRTPSLARQKAP